MRRCVNPLFERLRELSGNVFPKGFPLPFTVPDILTLEERNLETALFGEDVKERHGISVHQEPTPELVDELMRTFLSRH
jgi:hypothetical protein